MSERQRKSTARQKGKKGREVRQRPPAPRGQPAVSPALPALLRYAADHPEASPLRSVVARQLLALQATHGNQYVQRAVRRAQRPATGAATEPGSIQRQGEAGGEMGTALKATKDALDPAKTKTGLLSLDLDLKPPPPAWLMPPKPGEAPAGEKKLPWKPGAGPKKPRAATGKDVAKAIAAIPAVNGAMLRMRTAALSKMKRDYGRLKTGEKAALITTGVILGGAALAGIASSPEARKFALDQLHGKNLPVPGTPVQVKFMTAGGKKGVMFMVDVAALLRKF